ncbi:hypothetical protein R50073_01170 [Maricurvus nonylphenolicus]|uniref:hypothetical protein n=1 Tax=Maricurvus nonylphenolicus TaxID=1008307 RepID=UPI0036F29BFF
MPFIRKSILAFLCICFFLVGCSVTNEFQVATYETAVERKYPPISVFHSSPIESFVDECQTFDKASIMQTCNLRAVNLGAFQKALKNSGMFADVLYADRDVGYRIVLSSASYVKEDAADIGSAALAGATLLVAPVQVTSNIKVNASLKWHDVLLETVEVELPFTQKMSLLTMDQDHDADIAKSVSSFILKELQEKDAFRIGHVAEKLQSSNYDEDLILPEQLGSFIKEDFHWYDNPFYGYQTRYSHTDFLFNIVDVFVYPIRSADLTRSRHLLKKEFDSLLEDIDLAEKEGFFRALSKGEPIAKRWHVGIQAYDIMKFSAHFLNQEDEAKVTFAYLFLLDDKYVKVRATFADNEQSIPDVDRLIQELIGNIKVPKESLFMARTRKQWRDQQPY